VQSQLAIERIGACNRQAKDVAQETQGKFATVTMGEVVASRQKIDELLQVAKQTPVPPDYSLQ
jgi:hypothetical protein